MKTIRTVVATGILIAFGASRCWAAITVDLTSAGSFASNTGALGGQFIVQQIDPQSTGTGVIDPFLSVQRKGNEQGYNTDNGTPLDTKRGGGNGYTRSLLLSEVPIVHGADISAFGGISGVDYRQFLLDINQDSGGTDRYVTLNQIQFFTTTDSSAANISLTNTQLTADLTDATASTPPQIDFNGLFGLTEAFRINNSSASPFYQIKLDFQLNSGSGSGDMFLYVPVADFGTGDKQIVMYTEFGSDPSSPNNFPSNDGFEEWAVLKPAGSTIIGHDMPEPASMAIWALGLALCGSARALRQFRRAA